MQRNAGGIFPGNYPLMYLSYTNFHPFVQADIQKYVENLSKSRGDLVFSEFLLNWAKSYPGRTGSRLFFQAIAQVCERCSPIAPAAQACRTQRQQLKRFPWRALRC